MFAWDLGASWERSPVACWGPMGCCGCAGSREASRGEDRRGQGLAAFLAPWVLEEERSGGLAARWR